ncbi:MAG: energy-coupling factor transporter ATPase [Coriobacteriia bacterium]|nr:energy-coupling factor transporter ATPase [Coriobacteriia bacterium]
MIRVSDVSFSYDTPEGPRTALRGVSLALHPGRHVAVLGANGSGKSTLAKLLDGLLLPDRGSVTVDGMDTREPGTAWDVRARVGIVFQDPDNQIVGTVVEEDVAFAPENLGLPREEIRRRVDEALEAVGLAEVRSREPHLLSEGQKQRLAIAGVLAMRPAYVVFDEPAAMLDPRGREDVSELMERLRADGHGILHVTHDLSYVPAADETLVLAGGRAVFAGPPAELLASPEVLTSAGLALPPIGRLAEGLRRRGVPVPAVALDAESVVASLWR